MKKIIVFASVILAAVAVFSCAKEQNTKTNSDNSNYEQNAPKPPIITSACYMWWQIEGNDTVCVNYHYKNQVDLVLCGAVIPNDPECEDIIVVGPKYVPGDDGKGYELQSLTIYNYEQMHPDQKVLFDRIIEKGEITIMNGITIENDEMLEVLGDNDFVEGGTYPISLVDDKPVITLK